MTLSEQLRATVDLLTARKAHFALAGGLVASLYRPRARLTEDLDFVLLGKNSVNIATEILEALNLSQSKITKAQLEGGPHHQIKSKKGPFWMVVGRSDGKVGVDFLLSEIPWCERAVKRAQLHQVNFGFGVVPCLTLEDLILSKLYALKKRSDRFSDLDDLKEIFGNTALKPDLNYLESAMVEFGVSVPKVLGPFAPKELMVV